MENTSSNIDTERVGKVFVQSAKYFVNDNSPQWAAAIAYYGLLSVFPLLLAAAAISAYFVDEQWVINQATSLMGNFLPSGAGQIRDIVQGAIQARGQVGIISILVLVWSGTRVFGVVTKALNIAYDVNEPYGFFKRVLIEFLMVLTIGLLFVVALSLSFFSGFFVDTQIVANIPGGWFTLIRIVLRPALLLVSVFLMYKFVPRRDVVWWAALSGAALFTILFLVAQPLFTTYIQRFANYNLIYGPLAIIIIFVFWTWIASSLLLLGGEFVSHIQDMLVEKKSQKEVEENHERRNPTSPKHEQSPNS